MIEHSPFPHSAQPRVLVFGPVPLFRALEGLFGGGGICRAIVELPAPALAVARDVVVMDVPYSGQAAWDTLVAWRRLSEDLRPAVLSLYVEPAHRPLALTLGDALRLPYDQDELFDRLAALSRAHATRIRAAGATRRLEEARGLLRVATDRLSHFEASAAR